MTKRIYAPTDDAGQLARYSEIESYLSDATDLFDPEGLVFIRFAEVKDTGWFSRVDRNELEK